MPEPTYVIANAIASGALADALFEKLIEKNILTKAEGLQVLDTATRQLESHTYDSEGRQAVREIARYRDHLVEGRIPRVRRE